MNAQSICARWRAEAWDCAVLDSLIDPNYFSPPISPNGEVTLRVVACHQDYPQGRTFTRGAAGECWTRIS